MIKIISALSLTLIFCVLEGMRPLFLQRVLLYISQKQTDRHPIMANKFSHLYRNISASSFIYDIPNIIIQQQTHNIIDNTDVDLNFCRIISLFWIALSVIRTDNTLPVSLLSRFVLPNCFETLRLPETFNNMQREFFRFSTGGPLFNYVDA